MKQNWNGVTFKILEKSQNIWKYQKEKIKKIKKIHSNRKNEGTSEAELAEKRN